MNKCRFRTNSIYNKNINNIPFTEDDKTNYVKDCNLPFKNKQSVQISENKRNIINPDSKCALVTKKCDLNKYYIFDYDPYFWKDNRSNSEIGKIQELIDNNKDYFDLEYRSNCCNCISIVLNAENSGIELLKYISSITRSAKNILNCLPNWILRLYLDISIYEDINDGNYKNLIKGEYENILLDNWEYLFNTENVEIYTFICDDSGINTKRKRSLRFATLYD